MIVIHEALHLHIGSLIENVAIKEMPEAAQEPEGETQFQEGPEAAQDANLNPNNYTTDQGKPRCISPIIIVSLLHHYLCIISVYVH